MASSLRDHFIYLIIIQKLPQGRHCAGGEGGATVLLPCGFGLKVVGFMEAPPKMALSALLPVLVHWQAVYGH